MTNPNYTPQDQQNETPRRVKKWHIAAAGGVLVFAAAGGRLFAGGEAAPSAIPVDNGEPVPSAAASHTPEASPSPSGTPAAEATAYATQTPPTESDKGVSGETSRKMREAIALRYNSCDVNSLTNSGRSDSGEEQVFTVGASYVRNDLSAAARDNVGQDGEYSWLYPDLIPVGVDESGIPDGTSYGNKSNDSDFDELNDTFELPYDAEKGYTIAVAAQTSASGENENGDFVTTIATTICEGPVFTFDGNKWVVDQTPAIPLLHEPYLTDTVE